MKPFLHSHEAVLVVGSQNANAQDRILERSAIRPLQLLMKERIEPVPFFDSWGQNGVSSLAWHPTRPLVLFISTGPDLVKLDLDRQHYEVLNVPNLRDVHEMTMIGDTIWLANTGFDELVSFDTVREEVSSRVRLTAHKFLPESTSLLTDGNYNKLKVTETYHCNQVFEGFDGELYTLVHHVSGKQSSWRVAQRVVKKQGDGGVLNLMTNRRVALGLKAPHTVRKVEDSYWVFDSGWGTINVFSPTWMLEGTFPTKGWGRGADVSLLLETFYAGISATRRRYWNLGLSRPQVPNMVEAFSVRDKEPVGSVQMHDVEQINNVYVVSHDVASALLRLRSD